MNQMSSDVALADKQFTEQQKQHRGRAVDGRFFGVHFCEAELKRIGPMDSIEARLLAKTVELEKVSICSAHWRAAHGMLSSR